MAEDKNKASYPMIPESNWWSMRNQFSKTLPSTVSVNYLKTLLALATDPDVDLISPLFNSVKRDVALFAALSPSFAVALNHSFTLDLSKSLPGNSSSNSGGYIALSIVSHALPYVESVRQRFAKSVG